MRFLAAREKRLAHMIRTRSATHSKIATRMFDMVAARVPGIAYWPNEQPTSRLDERRFVVDCMYGDKVIEFNGDRWHANPALYAEDAIIRRYGIEKTAREIWRYDESRLATIRTRYDVLVIWESEFKQDPAGTIEKCVAHLKSPATFTENEKEETRWQTRSMTK